MFVKGIAIGLAVAAPVGPVGILCVQRTLHDGLAHGLATGFGAATADALFGAVAGFGLASVAAELMQQEAILRLLGALVLTGLAARTWMRRLPATATSAPTPERLVSDYGSGLAITLSNPMTILGIIGIFAALGLQELAVGRGATLIAGLALGSALWWLGLSSAARLFRRRLGRSGLGWLNRIAALMLLAFAVIALLVAFA